MSSEILLSPTTDCSALSRAGQDRPLRDRYSIVFATRELIFRVSPVGPVLLLFFFLLIPRAQTATAPRGAGLARALLRPPLFSPLHRALAKDSRVTSSIATFDRSPARLGPKMLLRRQTQSGPTEVITPEQQSEPVDPARGDSSCQFFFFDWFRTEHNSPTMPRKAALCQEMHCL